jgi:AraC-like DNA-binding protein
MRTERVVAPSSSLSGFIGRYLLRAGGDAARVVVRPVTASPNVLLVFNLDEQVEAFEYRTGRRRVMPAVLVVGPQTGRRAELFSRADQASLAVLFRPAGFHRLFHASVEPLADTAVDGCDVIGPEVGRLRARMAAAPTTERLVALVEAFLTARVKDARPQHPAAEAAASMLDAHGAGRVSDVVSASGLSSRQFERAFREQMGISPKLFARAARLDFALGLKRGNPTHTWTRVSQEAGYFDQTHFVKDFKALAGETPSTFPLTAREIPPLASRRPA